MNILVLNLTRFGDLLQSAATIRALAQSNNGKRNRIGIVCINNFLAGAALLPDVDALFPLPGNDLLAHLAPLPGTTRQRSWLAGLEMLHSWITKVRTEFSPDVVCNISPTVPACLLARLLAGDGEYKGFALDSFGFLQNTSP